MACVSWVLGMESATRWLWRSNKAFSDNRWWEKPRIFKISGSD